MLSLEERVDRPERQIAGLERWQDKLIAALDEKLEPLATKADVRRLEAKIDQVLSKL
jgi:hypothetical protein